MGNNAVGLLESSIKFNLGSVGPLLSEDEFPAGYTVSVDLILTNPTEWDWTYTVRCWLGPDPYSWWPIISQQEVTVPAGQSVTLTNEAFVFPAATGVYYPQAEAWETESQTYLGLFDFLPITLVSPPPPTSESITLEWLNAGPYYCGSEQQYTISHTNLDYVPITHYYSLCSCKSGDCFDTSQGQAFESGLYNLTLDVDQTISLPRFPIMGDTPGTYRVWIEVYKSSSRMASDLLGVIELGEVTLIAAPAPELDMSLDWGEFNPPAVSSVTWEFISDGAWEQILPDTFTGEVVLNDLVNVPSQIQTVWDLELSISWNAERGSGDLQTLVAGKVYMVIVTGACAWTIPLI